MNKKIFILCATSSGLDLIKLISRRYKISCVITAKTNRYSTSERISAKKFCEQNKIKCKEIKNYSNLDEIKKFILKQKIDILICISWQRLIPLWLIKKAKFACLGAHGSHEGMYLGRGRSPINWALLSGKKSFIISLFLIKNEEPDSGPEIFSKKFMINDIDDVGSVYLKCHLILSKMIIDYIKKPNSKLRKYQKRHRFLPKIKPCDSLIDWKRSPRELYNFIRSKSTPYPNAFTIYKNIKIKILSAKPVEDIFLKNFLPGTVIMILNNGDLLIQVKKGMLLARINKKYLKYIKEGIKFRSANFKCQLKNIINSHYKSNPGSKLNKLIEELSK